MNQPSWYLEEYFWHRELARVAGIDEAGRGAWAGPVTVAAVILPKADEYPFRDSKQLSDKKRQEYAVLIKEIALAYAIIHVPSSIVDQKNVLWATHQGALEAIEEVKPDALITDYLKLKTDLPLLAPAKADSLSYSVAAASLLAKTARDEYMQVLDQQFPQYGFAQHKGYGVVTHRRALVKHGVTSVHRHSYAPIKKLMQATLWDLIQP